MPSSINDLSGLEILSLAGCRELRSLPSSIHMKSLKYLYLSGCSKLTEFPEISKVMKVLIVLKLDRTTIKELPSSINKLTGLPGLSLTDCTSLVCLPDNICNLASLNYLNLTGCSSLVCLPDNICNLASLNYLDLSGCSSLVCLPDNICNLASLNYLTLDLTGCSSLVCLPDNISNLASLNYLNLTGCSSLVCLPDNISNLASLYYLDLTGCSSLVCLPDNICNLASLNYLGLTGCSSIVCPWDNICYSARLNHINLTACARSVGNVRMCVQGSGTKELPFSILRMKSLSCNGCKEMTAPFSSWPTWNHQNPSYSVLIDLDLSDCNLLELSDGIAHLSSLEVLRLYGNKNLESLPAAMNHLCNLRWLYLRGCKGLKSIPELSSSIQGIDARNCTSLETVSTPQPSYAEYICFEFLNCFKLENNTNIFIDIVESATQNQDYECHMSLPGSDIPDWFNHQSRGSSVTVQLPPDWNANKFLGFAICAISDLPGADNGKHLTSAVCCCTLKANDGQGNFYLSLLKILDEADMPLEADHMLLGYTNFRSLGEWHNERKYTEARFRTVTVMTLEDCTWITSCGVHLFDMNPPFSVDLI